MARMSEGARMSRAPTDPGGRPPRAARRQRPPEPRPGRDGGSRSHMEPARLLPHREVRLRAVRRPVRPALAAEMYPVLEPDLIVVQLISDDLTRGRWWTREAVIDGRPRAQISPSPDGFDDPRITNEQDVVDGRATEAWCRGQLGAQKPDAV